MYSRWMDKISIQDAKSEHLDGMENSFEIFFRG